VLHFTELMLTDALKQANGARVEFGIDHLSHLPENHLDNLPYSTIFLDHRRRKKEPRIRIPAGFIERNGVNYLAEFTSM
jgi:hypothetical protein